MLDLPNRYCCTNCFEYYEAWTHYIVRCPGCNAIQVADRIEKVPAGVKPKYAGWLDDIDALLEFQKLNDNPRWDIFIYEQLDRVRSENEKRVKKLACDNLPPHDKLKIAEEEKRKRHQDLWDSLETLRSSKETDFSKKPAYSFTAGGKFYDVPERILNAKDRTGVINRAVFHEAGILRELRHMKEAMRVCESVPVYSWNADITYLYLMLVIGDFDTSLKGYTLTPEQVLVAKTLEEQAGKDFLLARNEWMDRDPEVIFKQQKEKTPQTCLGICSVNVEIVVMLAFPIILVGSVIAWIIGSISGISAIGIICAISLIALLFLLTFWFYRKIKGMQFEVSGDEIAEYRANEPIYNFSYSKQDVSVNQKVWC